MPEYRALKGFNYTPSSAKDEVRVEPGETVSRLPVQVAKALKADEAIEEVTK